MFTGVKPVNIRVKLLKSKRKMLRGCKAAMMKHCPGVRNFIAPQIIIRACPFCGEEIEFFEYETQQRCPECGQVVYREASETCVAWCAYADKCINELEEKGLIDGGRAEMLRKFMKKAKPEA